MPPSIDDPTISDDDELMRGLLPRWITLKGGRERPTTDAFLDSNYENSCFLSLRDNPEFVQQVLAPLRRAIVTARLIRSVGWIVERRPDECPAEYRGNKADHVVIG